MVASELPTALLVVLEQEGIDVDEFDAFLNRTVAASCRNVLAEVLAAKQAETAASPFTLNCARIQRNRSKEPPAKRSLVEHRPSAVTDGRLPRV